jgi:hypothetical protein
MIRELVNARIAELLGNIDGKQRINIAFQRILNEGGQLEARKGAQIVFLLSRATTREAYRLTLETLLNLHSNHCGNASFMRNINETLTSVRMKWDCSEGRMVFIGPDSVPTIDYDYIEQGILSSEYEGLESEINELARSGLLASCAVMKRKLVENLMIDLLRNKYSNERNLFLITSGDRYKMYFHLVESIRRKRDDFRPACPGIDNFISLLENYREPGNIGAHNIVLNPTSAEVIGERDQFINLLRTFRRLLNDN